MLLEVSTIPLSGVDRYFCKGGDEKVKYIGNISLRLCAALLFLALGNSMVEAADVALGGGMDANFYSSVFPRFQS